jgi:hypothetical protein
VDILVWHVHGSWTTAFVQGAHRYVIPTLPERGPWGGGRPAAWDWPASAVEASPADLADADVDTVLRDTVLSDAAVRTSADRAPVAAVTTGRS